MVVGGCVCECVVCLSGAEEITDFFKEIHGLECFFTCNKIAAACDDVTHDVIKMFNPSFLLK